MGNLLSIDYGNQSTFSNQERKDMICVNDAYLKTFIPSHHERNIQNISGMDQACANKMFSNAPPASNNNNIGEHSSENYFKNKEALESSSMKKEIKVLDHMNHTATTEDTVPFCKQRSHDSKQSYNLNAKVNKETPLCDDKTVSYAGTGIKKIGANAINSMHILNEEKLKRFNKMVTLGIPLEAVIQKMTLENCTKDEITAFQTTHEGGNGAKTQQIPCKGYSEQYMSTMNKIEGHSKDKNHDQIATYKKMLSCKVPHQCVIHKMIQDGIASETIQHFVESNGIIISHFNLLPMPPKVEKVNVTTRQKIHWTSISKDKIKDSLWACTENTESLLIDDGDIKNVQELFAVGRTSGSSAKQITFSKKNECRCSVIDTKRSYNISIGLAQYKGFETYDQLCHAVASLDSSKLNREQIENMISLLPSDDEMKNVNEYVGGYEHFGKTEKFFLAVSKIPKFRQKLNVFLYIQQFEENTKSLHEQLIKFDEACRDIVSNKKLANILKRLLFIGNCVNESSGRPKSEGITIDSLIKTANKVGTDGKTKLIDVVTANFLKQDKTGDSITFWDELKSVSSASRIDIQDCTIALKSIQHGLMNINNVIDTIMKDDSRQDALCSIHNQNNNFIHHARNFLTSTHSLRDKLEHEYLAAEQSYKKLCIFFAEEPSICKVRN